MTKIDSPHVPDAARAAQGEEDVALPPVDQVDPDQLLSEARAASEFLKALGHEGRLRMLYYLCEGDLTVTELEQLVMSRQAAVSQQLARLRHERLVTTRRDGNQIIYSLADERVRLIAPLLRRMFSSDEAP